MSRPERKEISLDEHSCEIIRKALLVGLGSVGEIDRVHHFIDERRRDGVEIDRELIPLNYSGRVDMTGIFADALLLVSANDMAD